MAENARGFFLSPWEGLGEGAKLDADQPSSQPSPKGQRAKNLEAPASITADFGANTNLARSVRITDNLHGRSPNQRLDSARPGVVFPTIDKSERRVKLS